MTKPLAQHWITFSFTVFWQVTVDSQQILKIPFSYIVSEYCVIGYLSLYRKGQFIYVPQKIMLTHANTVGTNIITLKSGDIWPHFNILNTFVFKNSAKLTI